EISVSPAGRYGKIHAYHPRLRPLTRGPQASTRAMDIGMALPRALTRLDHPTLETVGEAIDRGSLISLSQRKLNALGVPMFYISTDERYRFANRAFYEWTGKS